MRNILISGLVLGLSCSFVAPATFADDAPASQPAAKEPVAYAKLKAILPDTFGGLKRTKASGSKNGMGGMKISQAEGEYGGQDSDNGKSGKITIIDYSGMPGMMEGLTAWTKMEIDNDSDTESSKTTKINGYAAMENYNKTAKRMETTIAVGPRFFVSATFEGLSIEEARAAIAKLDLKAIEDAGK